MLLGISNEEGIGERVRGKGRVVLEDTQLIPACGSNISVCRRACFSNTIYLLFALAVFSRTVGVLRVFCRQGSSEEI